MITDNNLMYSEFNIISNFLNFINCILIVVDLPSYLQLLFFQNLLPAYLLLLILISFQHKKSLNLL